LIDRGKYKEAKPYVDVLLFYYKTLDGENNSRYIGLLNCDAIIYQNIGNYKEAINIYCKLIAKINYLPLAIHLDM
jgi:tetratricopeptide (TPR) repeat protein